MKLSPSKMRLVKTFARGRITVARACAGPEQDFAARFFPKLAGKYIKPDGRPDDGYLTYHEALADAVQYRDSCRAIAQFKPERKTR